ncbi:DUF305 domain-containing protein [Thermithiobacillus tepidarius DSM 3134]|uniref:DUF305 domain-containing protein n=1 Tax=Thermithiobacillus tepidarius TaxID=929 RepID=UPI0009DB9B12|nr:DUF305 domain-containing protein [Thermithiobacillus tepidarius]
MRNPVMLGPALAFLLFTASGTTHAADSRTPGSSAGEAPAAAAAPQPVAAPYDLQFLDTMIQHHRGAIEMARLAEQKAQHDELKTFARKTQKDQQQDIEEMQRYRERWYGGKPDAVNAALPGMRGTLGMEMGPLQDAKGDAFDRLFLDMIKKHHDGAVALSKDAQQKAAHPELRKLAGKMLQMNQEDIKKAERWQTAWYSK